MAALFSNQPASGGESGGGGGGNSSHLLSFRAGKMSMKGKTVTADKRKGQLYVTQSEDMLMHLCWRDRGSGQVEDDLILFPDDTEFLAVDQCKTGRVFLLRFKNQAGRKLFFWMQEPSADKDAEHAAKLNELLNNPPTTRGASGGAASSSAQEAMLNQMMGLGGADGGGLDMGALGMDQGQMMQLLSSMMSGGGGAGGIDPSALMGLAGGGAASATPAAAASPAPTPQPNPSRASAAAAPGAIALSDLQSILSNMGDAGASAQAPQAQGPGVDLEDVLNREDVRETALGHAETLVPLLPTQTPAELSTSLRSPQFRQAAGTFGIALQSGQLAPVLREFGLPQAALDAAAQGDVESFAAGLEGGSGDKPKEEKKKVESPEKKEPPPKKEKKDQDNMDLD